MHKHNKPEKDIRLVKGLQSDWESPPKKSLLQNWPWMSTMVPYCLFGLHDTAYSEVKFVSELLSLLHSAAK